MRQAIVLVLCTVAFLMTTHPAYAAESQVSDPYAVKLAIEQSVATQSVPTTTSFPSLCASAGVTTTEGIVIVQSLSQTYLSVCSLVGGLTSAPDTAVAYVTANVPQLLAAGASYVKADPAKMSLLDQVVQGAKNVGDFVYLDLSWVTDTWKGWLGIKGYRADLAGVWNAPTWPFVTSSGPGGAYGSYALYPASTSGHMLVVMGWLRAALSNSHGSPLAAAWTGNGEYFVNYPTYGGLIYFHSSTRGDEMEVNMGAVNMEVLYASGMSVLFGVPGYYSPPAGANEYKLVTAPGAAPWTGWAQVPSAIWRADTDWTGFGGGNAQLPVSPPPTTPQLGDGARSAANKLATSINGLNLPDGWGWVKDVLAVMAAPIVTIINSFASVLDWFGNFPETMKGFVTMNATDAGLLANKMLLLQTANQDRFPLGFVRLVQGYAAAFQSMAAGNSGADPVFVIMGHPYPVPMGAWMDSQAWQNARGILSAIVWLGFGYWAYAKARAIFAAAGDAQ